MFSNFKVVPNLIFGRGCFNQIDEIIESQRKTQDAIIVFLVDDAFENDSFKDKIPLHNNDLLIWVNVDNEPKTDYVDELTSQVKKYMIPCRAKIPSGIIGIGGGSAMDLAKAVSLMLTNKGSSEDYQGWDLIKYPSIYHAAVPTLSGTGAEVSRTAVLTGPKQKLGINSDYTVFDQIILDPEMVDSAPKVQRFYTGMDCYIHCVESLSGTYLNPFSKAYGQKAMDLCRKVFFENTPACNDELMIASYFGGMSIAYSQVGICHALSYGLSFVLGIHHGISNCVTFNTLEEFYPTGVKEFRKMRDKQQIKLPENIVLNSPNVDYNIERMITVTLALEPLWENALGKNWKSRITRAYLKELYLKI